MKLAEIKILHEVEDEYKDVKSMRKMGLHSNPGDEAFGMERSKPKGLDPKVREQRTFTRGFRDGFAGDRWGAGEGLSKDDMPAYEAGKKAGKSERKKHKGEVPESQLKNRFGERRNNPEFEKILKPILAAHLEKFKDYATGKKVTEASVNYTTTPGVRKFRVTGVKTFAELKKHETILKKSGPHTTVFDASNEERVKKAPGENKWNALTAMYGRDEDEIACAKVGDEDHDDEWVCVAINILN